MSIKQEIFDKAYAAVMAQKHPALRTHYNTVVCTYRATNGRRCAIGHLLSDEQIEKYGIMKGAVIPQNFPIELVNELTPGLYDAKYFLSRLQGAHDDAAFADSSFEPTTGNAFTNAFHNNMKKLALLEGLNFPSTDTV